MLIAARLALNERLSVLSLFSSVDLKGRPKSVATHSLLGVFMLSLSTYDIKFQFLSGNL